MEDLPQERLAKTGIEGLDNILGGGLTLNRLYLLMGVPGSGKTTLAIQFLQAGAACGEAVLYVTLSETIAELKASAQSHGWTLDGITMRELVPVDSLMESAQRYTMFHPSEVELGETTRSMLADIERVQPKRIVIDSLSELRLLSGDSLRFRRQILILKRILAERNCTVMLLDDLSSGENDLQLQSLAHGVIALEQLNPDYGADRRRLRVVKYRGRQFRGGYHDYIIQRGGLEVFPRLIASEHRQTSSRKKFQSGDSQLDQLLGGGIEQGTSTLIVGAPGTGKSSLAVQFADAAAQRGESAAMFIFDESITTLLARSAGMGLDLQRHLNSGRLTIQSVDPAELSPGQFATAVRKAAEVNGVSIVVIDSLNGYLNAMPDESYLVIQLHEMLTYLGQIGIGTILIGAHQGMIGGPMRSSVDVSYLSDTVIMLRYFETDGEVRQAISVVKRRGGNHERTIREMRIHSGGIKIGEPLRHFRGVLSGTPIPVDRAPLAKDESA